MAKKTLPKAVDIDDIAVETMPGNPEQTISVSNVEKPVGYVDNSISSENLIGLKVAQVEFGVGAHLMGQHLTLSASRGSSLEIADKGILAKSKSGRVCLLPWSNLKVVEILPAKISLRTGRLK